MIRMLWAWRYVTACATNALPTPCFCQAGWTITSRRIPWYFPSLSNAHYATHVPLSSKPPTVAQYPFNSSCSSVASRPHPTASRRSETAQGEMAGLKTKEMLLIPVFLSCLFKRSGALADSSYIRWYHFLSRDLWVETSADRILVDIGK